MKLERRQLDAFEASISGGSLSSGAKGLNLTLAATSLRIKALEEHLGQRLLVRGKVARATPAGQALLAHIKRVRLLETDLAQTLKPARQDFQVLNIAVNADSLASWFMHGVQAALTRQRLTLQVVVDDQDHTLEWLKNGEVIGCVTTLARPLRGCVAEALGEMRYRCVAAPDIAKKMRAANTAPTAHQLFAVPAICFNRKDGLQDQFLQRELGLADVHYPRHYLPAVDAYHQALVNGLGWGMEADIQHPEDFVSGQLVDLFPGRYLSVPLFWQHWLHEPPQAALLTTAIKKAAQAALAVATGV